MKFILAFITLTLGLNAAGSPCAYYARKSQQLGCAPQGYLMSFGYRYCSKFLREQVEYSPAGQNFMQAIRTCLIRGLEVKKQLNCSNVKAIAERSHVKCYLENGFCSLTDEDKAHLFFTVWPEVFDPGFSDVMSTIQKTCELREPN